MKWVKFFILMFVFFMGSVGFGEIIQEEYEGILFSIECNDKGDDCYLSVKNKEKKEIYKVSVVVDINRTSLIPHENHLLEIFQRFGTNDSYSIFCDYEKMKINYDNFSDVIAVDSKHHLVAYSEDNVMVKPIFNNQVKPYEIKRNFDGAPSISAWRSSSYFTPDGNLVLDYMAIENNEPVSKTECISLPGTLLNEE